MSLLAPSACPMLAALLVAACASSPPPAPLREGEEELELAALSWTAKQDLFTAPGPLRVPESLEGVRCTLSNDKGSWTVTAPGRVKVQRSAAPLVIDCAGEGFSPYHETRRCVSPREQQARGRRIQGPLLIVLVPLAIVAAPVAPQIAVQAAGQAALGASGMAAGEMSARSKPDVCSYGRLEPAMTRR